MSSEVHTAGDPVSMLQNVTRISDALKHHAASTPQREAVVFKSRRLTFEHLNNLVDRFAKSLLAQGIRPGDRVAYLGTSRPEYWVSFLGTSSIGATWLGLNPKYQFEELAYVVSDARSRMLLGQTQAGESGRTENLTRLRDSVDSIESFHTFQGEGEEFLIGFDEFLAQGDDVGNIELEDARAKVRPSDPALIVYTSGTTGRPKGAMLPHQGLVTCSKIQNDRWPISRVKMICDFPINHIACVGDISCFALVNGGTLYFRESFDPAESLRLIEREQLNILGGVPTMLQMIVAESEFRTRDLSSLEYVVWGGAAASLSLLQTLATLGTRLVTSYGMTETVGSVTYSDPSDDIEILSETIGRPDPRYEVAVFNEAGRECAAGESGEIRVRGDFIMLGYLNRPEATAETIDAKGWLHTGDVASVRRDGRLELVGRLTDMYKSGGYNVYPREIEMVLEEHPDVEQVAVIGVSDPTYQEVGHAFVVLSPNTEMCTDALKNYCAERLANYKVPKRFLFRESLPLLPLGKVDKTCLKEEQQIPEDGSARSSITGGVN